MAEKKEKMCPQRFHPDGDGICIKEKCEWWNDKYKMCAIALIAQMSTREIRDA